MLQAGVLSREGHSKLEKEKASMAGQERVGEWFTRLVKDIETALEGVLWALLEISRTYSKFPWVFLK